MINLFNGILILLSAVASLSYSVIGMMKANSLVVYNNAGISHLGIQFSSFILGVGGMLLLFPPTFRAGGSLLILHSLFTILCFVLIRDWRGGFFELLAMIIPVFMLWAGYPLNVLEKIRSLFH